MSRSAFSGRMATLAFVTIIATSSITWAQNYGPNPGSSGFLPLADGPVYSTAGSLDTDANASLANSTGSVALGNGAALTFRPGSLSLTLANTGAVNGGLYNLFAALGNLDFVYETMTGALIRVTSFASNASIVVNVDMSGIAGINPGTDFNGSTGLPSANPTANGDTTATGTIDASPGNPYAN